MGSIGRRLKHGNILSIIWSSTQISGIIYREGRVKRIMKMKIFRIVTSLVILFGLAGLVGCQAQTQPVPEPVPSDPQAIQTMNVAVYYLKDKNNEMYLVREVHKVEKRVEVARAALHELISGNPLTSGATKVLPADTKILGIKIENGLATVDFSGEVLKANVGSTGEALGIASIVNTLTEFPTVQQVQFTVDGKAENGMGWWGHVGLYEQPFKRNLSAVYEPVIWVNSPIADQTIISPVRIKGNARIFEAMVSYRLRDADGNILAQGSTMAAAGAPERGDFEAQLSFTPASVGKGQLEVYEVSMKDGSEMNMVIVPVQWQSK